MISEANAVYWESSAEEKFHELATFFAIVCEKTFAIQANSYI